MRIANTVETIITIIAKHGMWLLPVVALAVFATGCTVDANATAINMFPTAIPRGTTLPTFVSLATPVAALATAPAAPTTASGPTTAPTIPPTVTFRFVSQPTPPTLPPTLAQPTAIPTLDSNWSSIAAGVDWRRLSFQASDGTTVGVVVVRIDPASVTFKVVYNPGESKMIQDWRLALPGAVAIVNASFFDQSQNPIGLVAVDGNLTGQSIGRADAGMFQVENSAPKVRSLFLQPYNNTERFDQAAQGFPVLVASGQVAPAFNADVSSVSARRTVIAQDAQGHILFVVTPFASVALPDLAKWLGVSGLEIDTAINMDGGKSTCLYLATGGPSAFTLNMAPVPVVVAVYPH